MSTKPELPPAIPYHEFPDAYHGYTSEQMLAYGDACAAASNTAMTHELARLQAALAEALTALEVIEEEGRTVYPATVASAIAAVGAALAETPAAHVDPLFTFEVTPNMGADLKFLRDRPQGLKPGDVFFCYEKPLGIDMDVSVNYGNPLRIDYT